MNKIHFPNKLWRSNLYNLDVISIQTGFQREVDFEFHLLTYLCEFSYKMSGSKTSLF